jgi:hypothetical protein
MKRIAIFGVPRSGTSWLSQLFNSHPDVILRFQPLFSHQHKNRLSSTANTAAIDAFFEEILDSTDPFALMQSDLHRDYPVFAKSTKPTHLAFKETRYLYLIDNLLRNTDDVQVIGIVRNPLAVLASWIDAPKEFAPDWDIREEWRFADKKNKGRDEEYYGFERWKQIAEQFVVLATQTPERFFLVKYDELIGNTVATVETLFTWCGLTMHTQVNSFIEESTSTYHSSPYSVFKGRRDDNDWRARLPGEIVADVIEQMQQTALGQFI